jgi:uncharacterized membrane protein
MMEPAGWIWMLIWIAALLLMVWLIVRRPERDSSAEDARSILRARFARGEISETEFERACTVLRTDRLEVPR